MSMPAEKLTATKTIAGLLEGLAAATPLPVSGVASDSRRVTAGGLFLACAGERSHGLDYADDAVRAGAVAIAYDASTAAAKLPSVNVPMIAVPGLERWLGTIANRFHESPSEQVGVIGVTGTNGKTTVAWLLARALGQLGHSCGYVGTLGYGIGEIECEGDMTTPGAVELIGRIAAFRDRGAENVAIEVSSHALAQDRIAGLGFEAVLFTNLSRDHLDYHGDMRSYFEAKARLFTACPAKYRVVNIDSEYGAELASRCGQDAVIVSMNADRPAGERPFVFARSLVTEPDGYTVGFSSSWGDGHFRLRMPGEFNVANAVLVLAALLVMGVPPASASRVMGSLEAPPGRLQRVAAQAGLPDVYVDYAHTPNALDVVLRALRGHCRGQLWCVFGCGGERDRGKRPQMAAAAEQRADRVVITTDNPRREAPDAIIADIVAGLSNPYEATVIEDRATAIAWAIAGAAPDDIILLAGKGHEDYQLVGTERRAFCDYLVALASLEARVEAGS